MLRRKKTWLILLSLMASLTHADEPGPNILFCIADDAGMDFGAYGCTWVKTPNFDRVAQAGLLFNRAYTPNAKCAPSRATILTGRYSWQLEEAGNHVCVFPKKFKGFMEALNGAGYTIGFTGKGWGPGNTQGRKLTGPHFGKRRAKPPANRISQNDYAANFKDFMENRDKDKPWCFWYGTTEPHRGFEFQSGVNKNGRKLSDIPTVPAYWPDNETVRHDMLDYGMEVEHYDTHLGRILDTLDATGELDHTLVVVTSDHGRAFPREKGQVYERSNHIPFAMMWKNGIKKPGRVVDDFINFTDLAPTFLEVAGLSADQVGMQPLSGRSLMPIMNSVKSGRIETDRDHVLVGKERHDLGRPQDWGYPVRGIIKENFLYHENFEPDRWPAGNPETGYLNCDGSPTKTDILNLRRDGKDKAHWDLCFGKRSPRALYHIGKDADCVNNLAENPEYKVPMEALRKELYDRLKAQGDPRMEGKGDLFDTYPYAQPQNANYYERYMNRKARKMGWVNGSDYESEPLEE